MQAFSMSAVVLIFNTLLVEQVVAQSAIDLELRFIVKPASRARFIAFLGDSLVFLSDNEKELHLYKSADGTLLSTYTVDETILAVTVLESSVAYVTQSHDLYQCKIEGKPTRFAKQSSRIAGDVYQLASNGNNLIGYTNKSNKTHIYDMSFSKIIADIPAKNRIRALAFSVEGSDLATLDAYSNLSVWSVKKGIQRFEIQNNFKDADDSDRVDVFAFSEVGVVIYIVNLGWGSEKIVIRNLQPDGKVFSNKLSSFSSKLAVDFKHSAAYVCERDGKFYKLNILSFNGKLLGTKNMDRDVRILQLSPDNTTLVAVDSYFLTHVFAVNIKP